jgi:type II secretory pathway pseudopilin PulG
MLTIDRVGGRERGTILLIFPAAVLVMFLLGAIVIDVALTQVRGRELEAVAGSAANDALAALDVAALREGRGVVIDEGTARARVAAAVANGPLPQAVTEQVTISVDPQGRTVIAVTLRLDVELVMAPAVGSIGEVSLRRTERATILGSELP